MLLALVVGSVALLIFIEQVSAFRATSPRRLLNGPVQRLPLQASLIAGINKYSHDASLCLIDSTKGDIVFAQAKERLSGKKHDGGGVADLIEYALDYLDARPEDITTVVNNNHHYRVNPYERRLTFASALKYEEADRLRVTNLLPHAKKLELSHHLAHAWSVVGVCPFDKGLVVVMDGMGESYRAMVEDISGVEEHSGDYMHDLKLLKAYGGDGFVGQPMSLHPACGYREAETAYVFNRAENTLRPVFKRWSRERSPPELYNHGFENMESMGAVYSRISSQILGDWNACGKIMGLAPWNGKSLPEAKAWGGYPGSYDDLGVGVNFHHAVPLMRGNPYDGSFEINWQQLEEGLPEANQWSDARFDELTNLAASCQDNLESSALALVHSLKESTGEENLCIAGGVGLNSVLNGRLSQEGGFREVYVPPGPGDEGIAVGCALYGLHNVREEEAAQKKEAADELAILTAGSDRALNKALTMFGGSSEDLAIRDPREDQEEEKEEELKGNTLPKVAFPAYQGGDFSEEDLLEAIDEHAPWVDAVQVPTIELLAEQAAADLATGKVLGWFQGKSEFGQRALGNRSILGDPRSKAVRIRINDLVKQREWWRPLAPSVLAEHAGDWFEGLKNGGNESPYMSLTANFKKDKLSQVPAVAHIDGSARLQTVRRQENSLYHALVSAFFAQTEVPMVLNTSFNRKGQPIVETPAEAIKTFLSTEGSMDKLYLGSWVVTRRPFPLDMAQDAAMVQEDLVVDAEMYYRSEVTSSSPSAPTASCRITVDCGERTMELPSQLHLDLLQLLQPAEDDGQGGGDSINKALTGEDLGTGNYVPAGLQPGGTHDDSRIRVGDLFEAMSSLAMEGEEEAFSWSSYKDALHWLYDRNLVSFENTAASSPEQLFGAADSILDLRGMEGGLEGLT